MPWFLLPPPLVDTTHNSNVYVPLNFRCRVKIFQYDLSLVGEISCKVRLQILSPFQPLISPPLAGVDQDIDRVLGKSRKTSFFNGPFPYN
jgi:hypothetical protein